MIPFPGKNRQPTQTPQAAPPANLGLWWTYVKERCPLASYALLSVGIAWSPLVLSGLKPEVFGVLWASVLVFAFFVLLRLMDEVKDYRKDVIAHPERPLPRGLFRVEDAQRGVQWGLLTLWTFSVVTFLLFGLTAGVLYGLTTGYLYLMYREFFCGPQLDRVPLAYAASHQAILFLLGATAAACHSSFAAPGLFTAMQTPPLGFFLASLQIFPAFFAYEVGRKMDPKAPEILKYYRSVYGLFGCRLILSGLAAMGLGALWFGLTKGAAVLGPLTEPGQEGPALGPLVWMTGASLGWIVVGGATWFAGDKRFGWIALATTLNLLLALYTPILAYYL